MDYFSYFSKLIYDGVPLPNVFTRSKIVDDVKNNAIYFMFYLVQEGETPDSVAYNAYKNPNLYWLIMLTNNMLDPQFDWPLASNELDKLVERKYGLMHTQDAHHYETTAQDVLGIGVTVDSDYAGSKRAVSNYEYESKLNDAKRAIKLIRPEYLNAVLTEFKTKMAV